MSGEKFFAAYQLARQHLAGTVRPGRLVADKAPADFSTQTHTNCFSRLYSIRTQNKTPTSSVGQFVEVLRSLPLSLLSSKTARRFIFLSSVASRSCRLHSYQIERSLSSLLRLDGRFVCLLSIHLKKMSAHCERKR